MNIDWQRAIDRCAKASVTAIVAAFLVFEIVSRTFVWWALKNERPDGQVGFGGWAFGVQCGIVTALVIFPLMLFTLTFRDRKAADQE